MKKKLALFLGILLMLGCFAGCSGQKTLTGQITALEGQSVTVQLGTLAQDAGNGQGGQQGTPPAKPEGENDTSAQQGGTGTAPAAPQGDTQTGQTPLAKPEGEPANAEGGQGMQRFTAGEESMTVSVDEETAKTLSVGDVVRITLNKDQTVQSVTVVPVMLGGGPGGGSQTETNGTSAYTIDKDTTEADKTYTSENADENALRVENGAKATLNHITVTKTAGESSNTGNSDFYGMNAGILVRDGAMATIQNATINTSVAGGNGVFCYGSGTTLTISDSKIRTTKNNSGGIETAGGGTTKATNLDIDTKGNSAAAIRSDRGGGTVTVQGGTYVTHGTGSPAVYSTADITVSKAQLTANSSEAIVIEGKNSVTLNDCTVTGAMSGTYGTGNAAENIHNVMIYQSMSGDAAEGEGKFAMTGGKLIAKAGDMFYVTNTNCSIDLTNVELTLANDTLLRVAGNDGSNGWGTAGANGGTAAMTVKKQTLSGKIVVDKISALTLTLKDNSTFTGTINPDGQTGTVKLTLESGSTWNLTADAYLTEFNGSTENIAANGHHVYVNGTQLI